MKRANKKYCRTTVLLFLAASLVMPPAVLSAEVGAAKKASAALQTPISSTWVNESIDKVLMDMADTAGIDIVKSPDVTGDVTAKVTGVPLEEALGNILAAHSFTYVATDNMIRVMPISEVERATKEELVSKVYQITYADANEVAAALQRFISDKGSVAFTKGTRHIAVTDTEKKMKVVDKFILHVDRETQQVLVEVKIYDITMREGFDLGAAFHAARNIEYEPVGVTDRTTTTTTVTPAHELETVEARDEQPHNASETTIRPGFTEGVTFTDSGADRTDTTIEKVPEIRTTETIVEQEPTGYYAPKRGKPFVGASFDKDRGGTLSFSLLDDAVDFEFALNVLKKEVESKLLANPRILVLDNETADFGSIREIPYREMMQVAREDPISYTEFKNVGVQLKVTPHIARNGLVKLHIAPEFGILVSQDIAGVPTVDTRRAETTALIKDGQTIAIGGLRQRQTSKEISKVPLLGDIPLLGNLFRSSSESVEINELVVLITPRIISGPEQAAEMLGEDSLNGTPKAFRRAAPKPKPLPEREYGRVIEPSAIQSGPAPVQKSPELMLQLGYGYIKMGRFELAKDVLASVVGRDPGNSRAYQYLGYCHLQLGDLDGAIDCYRNAITHNDADWEAHRGLGIAYMLKARRQTNGDLGAKAVEHWRISLDIKPDQANREALIGMIKAYSE